MWYASKNFCYFIYLPHVDWLLDLTLFFSGETGHNKSSVIQGNNDIKKSVAFHFVNFFYSFLILCLIRTIGYTSVWYWDKPSQTFRENTAECQMGWGTKIYFYECILHYILSLINLSRILYFLNCVDCAGVDKWS
jgi:hypothetical protein